MKPGAYAGDIGYAIQSCAEKNGYAVVRNFCGSGIGRELHCEPQILNFGRPGTGKAIVAGMAFSICPIINAGGNGIRELTDGFSIVTKDHGLSAQWKHVVLATAGGVEVLTCSGNDNSIEASFRKIIELEKFE